MGAAIEKVREAMPDAAKDIRLNLPSVLEGGSLTAEQRWMVALACGYAARNPTLRAALEEEARSAGIRAEVIDDAKAAAALMAMNNVYYRFRHFIGKPVYGTKRPNLRMNRIAQPLTSKADFELTCLAVSAINGCEMCVRSHEEAVLAGGLSEEQVHDAVRIAATLQAAAVSLEIGVA